MRFRHLPVFFLVIPLAAGGWSCNDNNAAQKRYDKIASAYCECMTPLAALNQKGPALLADTTRKNEQTAYFQQVQDEYNKAKECAGSIVGQFGHLKPEELNAVEKTLSGRCPAMAGQRDLLQEMLGE